MDAQNIVYEPYVYIVIGTIVLHHRHFLFCFVVVFVVVVVVVVADSVTNARRLFLFLSRWLFGCVCVSNKYT